jgi:tRNA-2-methylthio-N6-dimethylallyladenosine synthase
MIAEVQRDGRAVIDVSFPEIEKFDRLPAPRAAGATAFVSIMEGCSKYCTFCVVPYTRGAEVSRPLQQVLAEVRGLVAQGVSEITLLGQNVNAYRGDRSGGNRGPCGLDLLRGRVPGIRAHPLHDLPGHSATAWSRLSGRAQARELPSAGAERLGPHPRADEARAHHAQYKQKIAAARARPGSASRADLIVGFGRVGTTSRRRWARCEIGFDQASAITAAGPVLPLRRCPTMSVTT